MYKNKKLNKIKAVKKNKNNINTMHNRNIIIMAFVCLDCWMWMCVCVFCVYVCVFLKFIIN